MQPDEGKQLIEAAKCDLKRIVEEVRERAKNYGPCTPAETLNARLGKWAKKWRETLRRGANCDPVLVRGTTGLEVEFNVYSPESSPAKEVTIKDEIREAFPHLAEAGSCSASQLERMREAGVVPGRRTIREFNDCVVRPQYTCNDPDDSASRPRRAKGEGNSDRWPPAVIASKFPIECREILKAMTQYQKHVFVCFYALGQKLAAIAVSNGTTESKVSETLSRIDLLYEERGIPLPCHVRPMPRSAPQIEYP